MKIHDQLQEKKKQIWQKLIAEHKHVGRGLPHRSEERAIMRIERLNRDLQAIIRVQRMFNESPQSGIDFVEGGAINDHE